MKKNPSATFVAFLLIVMIYGVFYFMMPQSVSESNESSDFSTQKALTHIRIIAEKPHYLGSKNHPEVAQYVANELRKMGLEPSFQEGFTLSDGGNLAKPQNVMAKIKGTTSQGKTLLLLAHYDSAPHSFSAGASDDGSGVATVLEGVRAFLASKTKPVNDIVILFTDAEEFGLNGAALFVNQHPWAKDVGVAVNFEARGSAGPSYMLMETNEGNSAMVNAFAKANPKYPVSNSLMYSIYKMLPNDTDLTVFREQAKIQGYNFAFIDDHFNYHTVQDDFAHVSPTTIAHQGTYLMALLSHFAVANVSQLDNKEDQVYFSTPFQFWHYPFAWILPLLGFAIFIFLALLYVGLQKKLLYFSEIWKGFLPFLSAMFVAGAGTFLLWQVTLWIHPEYKEILQGFTYNGHLYIYTFVIFSLATCFYSYKKWTTQKTLMSHSIAPMFLWIVINIAVAIYLKGASFLILPLYGALAILAYYVFKKEINVYFNLVMAIPSLFIVVPFIQMFPIGLGLKILFGSAILTVLCFGLLLPVFEAFLEKKRWAVLFGLVAFGFYLDAHWNSDFEKGKAKPNSLLYYVDANVNKAYWTTYDKILDPWTQSYMGLQPQSAAILNKKTIASKYNSGFTFMAEAEKKPLQKSTINFLKDSISGEKRFIKIRISPNRIVNRYDVFANDKMVFHNFKANGVAPDHQENTVYKHENGRVLRYLVKDNIPLEMEFEIATTTVFDMEVTEASFDLLSNPLFTIPARAVNMMPKPFVINDAILIKQKIEKRP
jgi:Peptidase family M28